MGEKKKVINALSNARGASSGSRATERWGRGDPTEPFVCLDGVMGADGPRVLFILALSSLAGGSRVLRVSCSLVLTGFYKREFGQCSIFLGCLLHLALRRAGLLCVLSG